MPLPLAIPVMLLAALKIYLIAHGLEICAVAAAAGYRAHKRGEDVVKAAMEAGASRAGACALRDFLNTRMPA
jgi:hypothetical protein